MPLRRHLVARGPGAALGVFLAAAVAVAQPGQNDSRVPLAPPGGFTPDQLKRLLAPAGPRPGDDLPADMMARIREKIGLSDKGLTAEQIDRVSRDILGNKALIDRLKKHAAEQAAAKDRGKEGLPPLPADFDRALKQHMADRATRPTPPTPPAVPPAFPTRPQPAPADPGGRVPLGPRNGPTADPPPGVDPGPGGAPDGFGPLPNLPPGDRLTPPAVPNPPAAPSRLPAGGESPRADALQAAAGFWEKNIGPLDETPAVKQILFDIVEGTAGLKDADGKGFWESFGREAGDGKSFADFLDGAGDGDWNFPKFDLPDFQLGGGDGPDLPEAPRENWFTRNFGAGSRSPASATARAPSSLGIDFGVPGMEGSWLPVVLLGAVLLGALIWWRFWYLADERPAATAGDAGLGGWPVDPRRLMTRRDVTLAFEYLSVLICGPAAKTWTHNTIARALLDLVETHGEAAVMLARLYELARYTPADEPLTTAELAEARRLVCRLAGLDAE